MENFIQEPNRKKTILIVDDHEETRDMYKQLLESRNFRVVEAKDGIEGLDIATSEENIDLIFTGIIMPRMDGFKLISSLKEYTTTSDIPVVVNSHLGREEDRSRAMELGVKDFIIRGITKPNEIIERINQALNQGAYILHIEPDRGDCLNFIRAFDIEKKLNCEHCKNNLSLKIYYEKEGSFKAKIHCPECNKTI